MTSLLKVNIVKAGSNAERSGLLGGDVLVSCNGRPVPTPDALSDALSNDRESPSLQVFRNDSMLEIRIESGPLGVVLGQVDANVITKAAVDAEIRRIPVTTAPGLDGHRIVRTIDIVSAEHAIGLSLIKDIFTSLTDTFGGRSETLQNVMRKARVDALNDLKVAAHELGGNAVVATRIEYSEFSGQGKSMMLVVAYGTAVCVDN